MDNVHVNAHPIVRDRLTRLRDKATQPHEFRLYLSEIATILGVDATRHLNTTSLSIETPLCATTGDVMSGQPALIVPILRAGLSLSDGLAKLLPNADTAHIGLYRDHETHEPVEYLVKIPQDLNRPIFVVDPMLATGHSMVKALDILVERGVNISNLVIITLVCAPEGIAALRAKYQHVPVYTAAIDSHLNENAYIVPGLGDAGDRYFGTNG